MIARLLFLCSLAGLLLCVHLWILKVRGFDQGCLGLAPSQPVAASGCADMLLEESSRLAGIPAVAWGYAFYFSTALLSLNALLGKESWRRRCRLASAALVAGALLYSSWLLFVQWSLGDFCPLCLVSLGLVLAMAGLHAADWRRRNAGTDRPRELAFVSMAGFGAMGLLMGLLLFVDRIGLRPLNQGAESAQIQAVMARSLGQFIDPVQLNAMRACRFDPAAPRLPAAFAGNAPFLGSASGSPVVAFYDPNCPHCRVFHDEFLSLAAKFGDRFRFVIVPRVLRKGSLLEAQALELAAQAGRSFEAWKLFLARQERGGLDEKQIAEVLRQAGVPTDDLSARLAAMRPRVLDLQRAARRAGVASTPALYVGGVRVSSYNLSGGCVERLLDKSLP